MVGRDDEVQRKMIEGVRLRIEQALARALQFGRSGDFAQMERLLRNMREELKNPKLPRDYVGAVVQRARRLEQDCYQLAIDAALTSATKSAMEKSDGRRNEAIKTAREYLSKAIAAGADSQFREQIQRKIDIILFTGKEQSPVAGLVNPISRNDPMTNRSKNEKRYYKRFTHPVLNVQIENRTFQTVDWSLGGMLVGGYDGAIPQGQDLAITFGPDQGIARYPATVKVVKIIDLNMALKFLRAPQETITYLRRLIASQTPTGR